MYNTYIDSYTSDVNGIELFNANNSFKLLLVIDGELRLCFGKNNEPEPS